MSAIAANLWARLGNCLFVWAHAKAYAEQNGHELRTLPWVGERIFTLDGHDCRRPDGTEVETLSGYFQAQKDVIYTRADCRRWFKLKPEIEQALEAVGCRFHATHAHFRRGDFAGAGFPLISRQSVDEAVRKAFPFTFGANEEPVSLEYISVSDETPFRHPAFTGDIEFLPDFYRLMKAPVLFRANSTFSWWTATLGHGRVFAPIITGLVGGVEHDNVPYVEGNWPKCADGMEFVTDLHLKEE